MTRLEEQLDAFNDELPALKEFILPGGGAAAAACHLARTVALGHNGNLVNASAIKHELVERGLLKETEEDAEFQEYAVLRWIFRADLSSFERKRFASLSHEPNSAKRLSPR